MAYELTQEPHFASNLWATEYKRFEAPMPRQAYASASCAVYVLSALSCRARNLREELLPNQVRFQRFRLLQQLMSFCGRNEELQL